MFPEQGQKGTIQLIKLKQAGKVVMRNAVHSSIGTSLWVSHLQQFNGNGDDAKQNQDDTHNPVQPFDLAAVGKLRGSHSTQ